MRFISNFFAKSVLSLFLLGFSLAGFSQKLEHVVGLQGTVLLQEGRFSNPSPAGGLFYSLKINNKLGVNFAPLYRQQYYTGISSVLQNWNNTDRVMVKYTLHYLEMPVNITYNLNKRVETGWKTSLTAGGTYQYFMGWTEKDLSGKQVGGFNSFNARGRFFANLGVEVSHDLSVHYVLTLNPGLKAGVFEAYPDAELYFAVKLGRRF